MSEAQRRMLAMLDEYKARVGQGQIVALGVVATTLDAPASAYVITTDDEHPSIAMLVDASLQLASNLTPHKCGGCGKIHRGLICADCFANTLDAGHEPA